jgi:hypothetical protein
VDRLEAADAGTDQVYGRAGRAFVDLDGISVFPSFDAAKRTQEHAVFNKLIKDSKGLPSSPKTEQNALIASAMCAAKEYTSKERAEDVLTRMPMALFRARKHIDKEVRSQGEFPVFRTKPRKDGDL